MSSVINSIKNMNTVYGPLIKTGFQNYSSAAAMAAVGTGAYFTISRKKWDVSTIPGFLMITGYFYGTFMIVPALIPVSAVNYLTTGKLGFEIKITPNDNED